MVGMPSFVMAAKVSQNYAAISRRAGPSKRRRAWLPRRRAPLVRRGWSRALLRAHPQRLEVLLDFSDLAVCRCFCSTSIWPLAYSPAASACFASFL